MATKLPLLSLHQDTLDVGMVNTPTIQASHLSDTLRGESPESTVVIQTSNKRLISLLTAAIVGVGALLPNEARAEDPEWIGQRSRINLTFRAKLDTFISNIAINANVTHTYWNPELLGPNNSQQEEVEAMVSAGYSLIDQPNIFLTAYAGAFGYGSPNNKATATLGGGTFAAKFGAGLGPISTNFNIVGLLSQSPSWLATGALVANLLNDKRDGISLSFDAQVRDLEVAIIGGGIAGRMSFGECGNNNRITVLELKPRLYGFNIMGSDHFDFYTTVDFSVASGPQDCDGPTGLFQGL